MKGVLNAIKNVADVLDGWVLSEVRESARHDVCRDRQERAHGCESVEEEVVSNSRNKLHKT